jgi:pilus assembly protein Flp/PilA
MKADKLFSLLRDEAGVTAIEYALLGALIAMAIVTSAAALGVNLRGLYEMVASRVQDATAGI